MSEYKRLTNNNLEEYDPEYDFCCDCEYFGEPNGCNRLNGTCSNYDRSFETYSRLAELEDKIESGELVKVPKGAVVLTPEERAEEMRLCNEVRKQAVIEFAERVKMAFYYEFDELIPSIMADKIDELVKEVCGDD